MPDRAEREKKLGRETAEISGDPGKIEAAREKRMQAERVLENSRAGILAKGLKEGQRCPVCGSLQHPELAALPEQFITEEEFEKFETQESMLQEQKNQANTEAEKEKTALEELEKQLRVESISCLKRAGTEQLSEAESLEELLKHLQTADETLLEKRKINQKQLLILQADCTALEKAEKDLAKIQENVEKQTDEIKILVDKKRETESSLLETKTLLGSLSELRYATWKEAEQVCTGAVKEAQQIAEEIQQRQRKSSARRKK